MMGILFAVIFPFVIGMLFWFLFRNRNSNKERRRLAALMIVAGAVEFAAVSYLFICVLNGAIVEPVFDAEIGGLFFRFRCTGFSTSFGVLTAFAWFVTILFSKEFMENDTNVIRYDFFLLLTLGAVMGIFYAADLFTLFFFFEIMSFTSFMWIAHRQTKEALYSAGTYLGIAIAGGMTIFMGLLLIYNELGTLEVEKLYDSAADKVAAGENTMPLYVAAGCMFAGFGAKAGAFPAHVWLPQSYTEAPAPAAALLSAILSKTGVFGLILVSLEILPMQTGWGLFILTMGVVTMVLGGIKGVMSDNFKTTLAFSSMSQIGFILVGVGMQILLSGTMLAFINGQIADYHELYREALEIFGMAANGTYLHMLNHSLVKLALFFIAGVVFLNVGSYELNKIQGFGHKKPFLLVAFLLAAAGVGGIPLLSGYISKSLLHESIVEYAEYVSFLEGRSAYQSLPVVSPIYFKAVEYLFLISGGFSIAYMIKLFVVVFVEKNRDEKLQQAYETKKNYASLLSKFAIGLCVFPIVFIGLFPKTVAKWIAARGFVNVGGKNLSDAMISVVIGVIIYFVIVRILMLRRKEEGYRDIFPAWLDMEKYVYRAVFYTAVPFVMGIICRILDSIVDTVVVILRRTVYRDKALPYELPEGNWLTHHIGNGIEKMHRIYCAAAKKNYEPKNYEHKLAIKMTDFAENFRIIERSLSFGLFMFCVGLGLTMIYLLLEN